MHPREPNRSRHRHDPEIKECTECGQKYDLARQMYYGPKCPDCTDNSRVNP